MQEQFAYMVRPRARHEEMLDEASRLHEAARAVREARSAAGEGRGANPATTTRHGAPAHHAARVGTPPSRRAAWRSAAKRMGSSLVSVGRRLERLGGAAD